VGLEKMADPRVGLWLPRALAQQDAYLEGAWLPRAQLSGVQLPSQAKLPYANFTGANLEGAILVGADLRNAFLDEAQLQDANLSGADLRKAHMAEARLQGAKLEGALLNGAWLTRIQLDRYSRCGPTNWGTPWEEAPPPELDPFPPRWWAAADVFRILRQHYHESGFYAREDEFYIREMHCRRTSDVEATRSMPRKEALLSRRGWRMWGRRMAWSIHSFVWGYGVDPWRTLRRMVACVGLFAVVFWATGVRDFDLCAGQMVSHSFGHALVLSLITFGTLGYGNRWPASLSGEALAGVEAVLAMLLMAMFVVSLARKYVRG
jgi:hypothetical protein